MLKDRGYILQKEDVDMTEEKFQEAFGVRREAMTILAPKKDDPTDQIFVFFSDEERVSTKEIKSYVDRIEQQQVNRAIIVCRSITPIGKRTLQEMRSGEGLIIEHFQEVELMINITEHELVPVHVVMNAQEKKDLLERYKLKDSQLPRIQMEDPIARYYGLQRGSVVRVIRPSETAGRYVTYRICV